MLIVKETTVWKDNTPNHVYVLSDDKRTMFGYVKAGTTERKTFRKGMMFDPRDRTFVVLKKVKNLVDKKAV